MYRQDQTRPRSRAEREFYGYASPSDQDFVRECPDGKGEHWNGTLVQLNLPLVVHTCMYIYILVTIYTGDYMCVMWFVC